MSLVIDQVIFALLKFLFLIVFTVITWFLSVTSQCLLFIITFVAPIVFHTTTAAVQVITQTAICLVRVLVSFIQMVIIDWRITLLVLFFVAAWLLNLQFGWSSIS
ncbi:hypothetical protein BgiBS90_026299 [Biomphalaria glabrata]|nr:hypothetical protein BgiBS90_026299 [Biomphalaria glabrata]